MTNTYLIEEDKDEDYDDYVDRMDPFYDSNDVDYSPGCQTDVSEYVLELLETTEEDDSIVDTLMSNLQRSLDEIVDTNGVVEGQDLLYIAVHAIFASALNCARLNDDMTYEEIVGRVGDMLSIEAQDLLQYIGVTDNKDN